MSASDAFSYRGPPAAVIGSEERVREEVTDEDCRRKVLIVESGSGTRSR